MRYQGDRVGEIYHGGSNHHFVEFDVDIDAPDHAWTLFRDPMIWPATASLWPGYYNGMCKRVGYNWPDQIPSWVNAAEFVIEVDG